MSNADRLIKVVRAEEQDFDLYCECCSREPVETVYRVEDENGTRIDLCLATYLAATLSRNEAVLAAS